MSGDDKTFPTFLFLSLSAPPQLFEDSPSGTSSGHHRAVIMVPYHCLVPQPAPWGPSAEVFFLCGSPLLPPLWPVAWEPLQQARKKSNQLFSNWSKNQKQRILPKAFYKGSTMLIPNPDKDKTKTRQKDCRLISLMNTDTKLLSRVLASLTQQGQTRPFITIRGFVCLVDSRIVQHMQICV